MAFSSRPVNRAEPTAAFRTVFFGAVNTNGTAKTDLLAATSLLHIDGAAGGATSLNFAHVSNGRYAQILSVGEVTHPVGTHLFVGPADGAGYHIICGEVVIAPSAQEQALVNLIMSMMGYGQSMQIDGTDMVLYDVDGTTELARTPFSRLSTPQNPLETLG